MTWLTGHRLIPPLILVLLTALFFWPYWAAPGRGSLESGDVDVQFYALAVAATARLEALELPLWNPWSYGGHPFPAEPQAALLYPPRWLTLGIGALLPGELPLPFWLFQTEVLAHVALAALLTYGFARRRLGDAGALVSATIYAFCGYLTTFPLLQVSLLETVVWLPGILWGLDVALAHPARAAGWLLAALPAAMCFLAGAPQLFLACGYTSLAWAVYRAWRARLGRAEVGRGLLVWSGTTLLLTAVQWWPTLEFLRLSPRITLTFQEASGGFVPRELLDIIVPHAMTRFAAPYVGLPPLLLAVGALLVPRRRGAVRFWLLVAIVALLLSLGRHGPLFGWFYRYVPGFGLFRSQERLIFLWSFALAMMAGAGVAGLSRALPRPARRVWKLVARSGGGLAGALLALTLIAGLRGLPAAEPLARSAIVALLTWGLLLARLGRRPRSRHLVPMLVALTFLDLAATNGRTVWSPEPVSAHERIPALLEPWWRESGGEPRALLDREAGEGALHPNIGSTYRRSVIDGASQLRLTRYQSLHDTLTRARWWELWGATHLLTWRTLAEMPLPVTLVATTDGGPPTLMRFDHPAPRARLLRDVRVVPDDERAVEILSDPAFDPARSLLVSAPLGIDAAAPAAEGTVEILVAEPERWVLRTRSSARAALFLAVPYYPGWRATVDGEPVAVARANHLWMALALPEGEHEVVWRFRPRGWAIAAMISALTALALATLLFQRRHGGG